MARIKDASGSGASSVVSSSGATRIRTDDPGPASDSFSRGVVLAALILFAANLWLHFPGDINNDARAQYLEAMSGQLTDWHPPIMAWLWSQLLPLWDSPAPILILHLFFHWLGFGVLAAVLLKGGERWIGWLVLLGGAFPVFIEVNASLWKDVGMASAWLSAFALTHAYRSTDRRPPIVVALVILALIIYGTLVRTNAIFGFAPLLAYLWAPRSWLRLVPLLTISLLLAVVALPASSVINQWVFKAKPAGSMTSLMIFDLAGIARHVGQPDILLPRGGLTDSQLRACYRPYWWDTFSPWGTCPEIGVQFAALDPSQHGTAAARWIEAIRNHPIAYAVHRLKHFNAELNFLVPARQSRFVPPMERTDSDPKAVSRDYIRKPFLVWPITWLVMGCVLLALQWRDTSPRSATVRVLLISALLYSLAYSVIGVAAVIRYYYWPMIAIMIAWLLAFAEIWPLLRASKAIQISILTVLILTVGAGMAARLVDLSTLVF